MHAMQPNAKFCHTFKGSVLKVTLFYHTELLASVFRQGEELVSFMFQVMQSVVTVCI